MKSAAAVAGVSRWRRNKVPPPSKWMRRVDGCESQLHSNRRHPDDGESIIRSHAGQLSWPQCAGNYMSAKNLNLVRGDQAWLNSVANEWQGNKYFRFHSRNRASRIRRTSGATSRFSSALLRTPSFPPNGFIKSESGTSNELNYQTPATVPITDFFAHNFRICDRWFSRIPAGRQANRLMAMSGYALIDANDDVQPNPLLAYDWLTSHQVRWCVYHHGFFAFYAMMSAMRGGFARRSVRPL